MGRTNVMTWLGLRASEKGQLCWARYALTPAAPEILSSSCSACSSPGLGAVELTGTPSSGPCERALPARLLAQLVRLLPQFLWPFLRDQIGDWRLCNGRLNRDRDESILDMPFSSSRLQTFWCTDHVAGSRNRLRLQVCGSGGSIRIPPRLWCATDGPHSTAKLHFCVGELDLEILLLDFCP